ncbi:MAG: HAD family phosphatase [Spirochaetaceae bacterium]|nr:HAD family phosphatase [Spirochaetaceae bacterium]
MKTISLICSDIDGTLLNDDKKINNYDREMLNRAYNEKHIPLVLASGRFKGGLTPLAKELGIPCGYSCFNGAYIELDNIVIKDTRIELEDLKKVIPIIKGNNSYPIIFGLDNCFLEDTGYWYQDLKSVFHFDSQIAPFEDLITEWEESGYRPFKMLAKDKDPQNLIKTQQLLQEANLENIDTFLSNPHILEIVPKGINKGSTIRILAEYMNIKTDNIMSFGDYNNDLELLAESGYGIAMDNAVDEVKAVAYAVTDTNNNSGIGKAISKYIFDDK